MCCFTKADRTGFIHAEPDAIVTLEGFDTVLKRFLELESTQKMIHPKSNYRRWLFDFDGNYSFASVYNNFGKSLNHAFLTHVMLIKCFQEIISRRFFESESYQSWFNFVDQNSTGIYSRRYGDAPIRSAGLSMFVDPEKVAWFGRQIGCAS